MGMYSWSARSENGVTWRGGPGQIPPLSHSRSEPALTLRDGAAQAPRKRQAMAAR